MNTVTTQFKGGLLRGLLLPLMLIFGLGYAQAQFVVPFTGSNTITACSGNVTDHAGATTNYNNSASGTLVINPTSATVAVTVAGSYATESSFDFITIFSGAGTGGAVLFGPTSGTGSLNVSGLAGQPITIRFTSDVSVTAAGFNLAITCSTPLATVIVPASGSNTVTTCGATIVDNGSTGNYANNSNGFTVITPTSGTSAVNLAGSYTTESSFDFIRVYAGTGTGGTLLFGPVSGTGSLNVTGVVGQPITIQFTSDASVTASGFSLTASCVAGPPACADFSFTGPFTHTSSTVGAGDNCSLRSGEDRVYAITITTAGCYNFSLCGSGASWDSYLLLSSACCGGTVLASNDDFCGLLSQISNVSLTPGTYYLDVEPFGSGAGAYTLDVTASPAPAAGAITASSPIFCGQSATYSVGFQSGVTFTWSVPAGASITSGQGTSAITVAWTGGSGTVSVVPSSSCGTGAASTLATGCTPPPSCNDFTFTSPFTHSGTTCGALDNSSLRPGEDVVYKITIPAAGCYSFSMCGTSPSWDSYMYLTTLCPGTGGTPGGGTVIASDDDGCGGVGVSSINNVSLAAGTYYLTIEPFGSACGAYTLNVGSGVPPAIAGITGPGVFGCNASASFSVPFTTGVTYTWATSNGTITSGQGSSSITVAWGSGTGTVTVTPSNSCGSGATVSTTATCTPPPANDDCSAAIAFTGNSQPFSTVFATGTDISSCTFGDNNDVWFTWVAPSCGRVTFSTCGGAGFDTGLSLFTSCGTGEIACNDDACGLQSTITATVAAGATYYLRVAGFNGAQGTGTISMTMTAPLVGAVSGTAVACFGGNDGTASAAAAGGSGLYTYAWSNGGTTANIGGLTAGTYNVVVTDGFGCTYSGSVTVTEPTALAGSLIAQTYASGSNISCAGAADGMIFANISGGTAPYSYAWSNGGSAQTISGLSGGSYTVVVTDANGCTLSQSITLTEPAPVVNTISAATFTCGFNVSCNGATDGAIDLTVTGGSGNYAFSWSNGATTEDLSGLGAGTYSVVATDQNGCSTSATITLTEPALLTTSLTTSVYSCGYGVSCNGASNGSITTAVSGGCAPYTYAWSTGGIGGTINGVAAGMYAVTVTDANGCQAFASAELTQPAPLSLSCTGNATVYLGWAPSACATITASGFAGGCPPYAIAWSDGATTASTTVCPTVSTDYIATLTDANGCTATCTTRVCVIDVRCGNGLSKITICHNPPGNAQTLCIAPSAVQNHLTGHGDHLGACGTNVPCAAPLKTNATSGGSAIDEVEAVSIEAFPNPFQASTTLRFTVASDDQVKVTVFAMDGRDMGTIFEGDVVGHKTYEVDFKANDAANGIYFAKLMTANGEVKTLKLVLMK